MMDAKSFPFPVISAASLDYPGAVEYVGDISRMDNSGVIVSHKITDDNAVARFLKEGRAVFACIVSLPSTMYRRVFVSDSTLLNVDHQIDYKDSGAHDGGEQPKFRPVVIKKGDCRIAAGDAGLDEQLWSGGDIHFPDGGIIAFDCWKEFKGGAGSLFQFKADVAGELEFGMIKVSDDTGEGFRFEVQVHPRFLDAMQEPGDGHKPHVRSVQTHALSRGLEILARDYQNNWREFPNLMLLSQRLESEQLPHWEQEQFCPDEVATRLYPHLLPGDTEHDSDS